MRKAFTLIELIFVIVIIGLLAAIAVPKFLNLKQSAQASSVVKTTVDAAQQAAEAAVNELDLNDKNASDFNLSNLVDLRGKGWRYYNTTAGGGRYEYNDSVNNKLVAEINFSAAEREVNYSINCNKFSDPRTVKKCVNLLNNKNDGNITTVHLTF